MFLNTLLFAALAIGVRFVLGQSCNDIVIQSCAGPVPSTSSLDLSSLSPYYSSYCSYNQVYTSCFSNYCTGPYQVMISAGLSFYCDTGRTAILPDLNFGCSTGYLNCLTRIPDYSCNGAKWYSSCYTSYCPGPLPQDVIGNVDYYCSGGDLLATATATIAPTTPASVSAKATATCNTNDASICLNNIPAPTCTAPSCYCPSFLSEYGCLTSHCPEQVSTGIIEDLSVICSITVSPPNSAKPTTGSTSSGGLSQPAKIGVGVGAGVGGTLAVVGVVLLLVKAGVFAGAGAGGSAAAAVAGGKIAAGTAGAGGSGAAASGANGVAPGGDMTMAGKLGLYGYTPGGEAANFTSPTPGYGITGAETGGNFTGYGPTGGEFTNQASMGGYGGPTGAETGNMTAPGSGLPTGGEGTNFSSAANMGSGPTGTEGANFSSPGTNVGPTGTEGANFSAPSNPTVGPTGTEGSNFGAPSNPTAGPTGAEASNPTAPGHPPAGHTGLDSSSFNSSPPVSPPPNAAYFAAPAAVVPLVAGAALLGRRKPVGSPVSSLSSTSSSTSQAPESNRYEPPNGQHELGGQGVYYGSELDTQDTSYMLSQVLQEGRSYGSGGRRRGDGSWRSR